MYMNGFSTYQSLLITCFGVPVLPRLLLPADQDPAVTIRTMLVGFEPAKSNTLHRDRGQDQRVGSHKDDKTGGQTDHPAQLPPCVFVPDQITDPPDKVIHRNLLHGYF